MIQWRAVWTKGPAPGGDDNRLAAELRTLGCRQVKTAIGSHDQFGDLLVDVIDRLERGCLCLQFLNQHRAFNPGMGGDVEDRLFRIKRSALPPDFFQRINDMGANFQHAQFENGK